jgi:hypothetical protein
MLDRFNVRTTAEEGWATLVNGKLLEAAERTGFDVFLSGDQNLRHQQRVTGRTMAIVVLSSNVWPVIQQAGKPIIQAVADAAPGSYTEVSLPCPPLNRRPAP